MVPKNSATTIPFDDLSTRDKGLFSMPNVKCAKTTALIAPRICNDEYIRKSLASMFFFINIYKLTTGLKCAPDTLENIVILANNIKATAKEIPIRIM
jgi:hypothetical protein